MYCRGLGMRVIGSSQDHDGFDGVMVGATGATCHLEFTCRPSHSVVPTPTPEDLLVFYVPTPSAWNETCADMLAAGFTHVASANPYWDVRGRTFEDPDGYRVVLENAAWAGGGTSDPAS